MQTRHWLLGAIVLNAAPLTLTACEIHSIGSSTSVSSSGSGGGATSSGGPGGSGGVEATATASSGSGSGGATSSSGSGGGVPCAPAASSVYAISIDKQLYRLDYDSALSSSNRWVSTLVGALSCPTSAEPYSIAIDRSAQAWVVYTDGNLFKVDTATAACAATGFVPGQHGFTSFYMAFTADAPESDKETLYVSGSGESGGALGLARIDRSTLTLTPVGAYDNALITAPLHLTGQSDGQLFGGYLWTNDSYFFATLDPTSAHVLDVTSAPSLLLKNLPPATRHGLFPWGRYYAIFITTAGGMREYDYEHPVSCSTDPSPEAVIPVDLLTLSASTCAKLIEAP